MSCIRSVGILERAFCLHREGRKTLLGAADNPPISATALKQVESGVVVPHQPLPKSAIALALHKQAQEVRTVALSALMSLTRASTGADWPEERAAASVTSPGPSVLRSSEIVNTDGAQGRYRPFEGTR